MMKQSQREMLIRISGMLEGITYAENDDAIAECMMKVQAEIDKMLQEDK